MPAQLSVDATVTLTRPDEDGDDIAIQPTDITYRSDRYDTAAMLSIEGLADVPDDEIAQYPLTSAESSSVGLLCEINDTLIGSGELQTGTVDEEGVWSGEAFDGIRHLRQTSFSGTYDRTPINDIIEDVFATAGVREVEALFSQVDGLPTWRAQYPETPGATEPIDPEDPDPNVDLEGARPMYRFTTDYSDVSCFEVLTDVIQDVNWYWWARPTNTIIVDEEPPSEEHQLQYVTETSAGKQLPPYQQVVVRGAQRPIEGDPMTDQIGSQHLVGRAEVYEASAGNGSPVDTYTDRSLDSESLVQATADAIFEEYQRQQASGSITAVGNPDIRSLDAVTLPDHLGGETYYVSAVTHTINTTDGFLTDITCGGLLDVGDGDLNTEPVGEDEDEADDDTEN